MRGIIVCGLATCAFMMLDKSITVLSLSTTLLILSMSVLLVGLLQLLEAFLFVTNLLCNTKYFDV